MFKKIAKVSLFSLAMMCLIFAVTPVHAKVTAEEAARLKTDLTPLGGERSGNADGSIPAWEGGLASIPSGISFDPEKESYRPDPFAGEKILFQITAQNMDKYADKLSEGQKGLLIKYPDTYRLNVYPTHRTAAAPQWVYENTYQNALTAEIVETYSMTGAFGGIPFPIPQNGVEAVKNHICRWAGVGTIKMKGCYLIYPDGSRALTSALKEKMIYPYYAEKEAWDGKISCLIATFAGPERRKGEVILSIDPLDYRSDDRKAWQYMPGQRRVRRAPNIAFDTPAPDTGGLGNYDDFFMFNGNMNRFDFRLVGKKECFIPYNNYKMDKVPLDDFLTPKHVNPDYIRWELHRIWVVEATLRQDKRHNYGKRIFYIDEDTWLNVLLDNFDTRGELWRTLVGLPSSYYDMPGVFLDTTHYYDLQVESYGVNDVPLEGDAKVIFEKIPDDEFTPQNVRKLGLR